MAHVFISCARDNKQEVQRLHDELTRRGVEVWLDKTQIKPGQNWKIAIAEAIDKGDFFLACFSKEYSEKSKRYMMVTIVSNAKMTARTAIDRKPEFARTVVL